AYCEYLRSINFISHALLEDAESRILPQPQEKIDSGPKYNPRPGHRRVLSEGGGVVSLFLPPEVFQRLQTVESQDTRKELTPIEEASRLNQKLKANCEARLARLPPAQARTQKTSLTLSLQRQMMENLIIAKARRFAASGTINGEEQEQRVLYTNILEYEQDHDWPKLWKAKLKKNPDDATLVTGLVSCLLSCPDHPVIKLLKRLQYRVYNRLYPIVSKSLPASPALPMKPSRSTQSLLISDSHQNVSKSGTGLSSDASLNISSSHDHNANEAELDSDGPHTLDRENLFEDMEQFLTQMDRDPSHRDPDMIFEPSQLNQEFLAIVKDIHIAIDQLLSLCLLSFECLNTANSKDLCVASIEEAFFTPIWSPLLTLFRKVHRERELSFESSMRLYQDASPGDVGVASKLYPQDHVVLHGSYPYESAVQELRLLCRDCCPQKKLECIVRTLRLICACAEDYCCLHEADSKTAAIGADDLLPILSYVALHCELPQLVSECAALEEFIHEGYLIGEEGYCLTSMQSALQYVESLHTGGFQLHNTKSA
uniref:VPS9 domain containing 1 n=1 Tax=Oncorhynchus mykiss TaxID=8022 RepID=A0A8C7PZJ3_ONCMY